MARTLLQAIQTKLGRCRVCMGTSLIAAMAAWAVVAAWLFRPAPPGPLIAVPISVAVIVTELLLMHVVAYVIRRTGRAPHGATTSVSSQQAPQTAPRGCGCH